MSPAEEANARTALAARDEATLGQIAKGALLPLLQAAGTAREVLAQAQAAFPKVLAEPLAALEQLVARLEGESDSLPPETRLTADLAESRDFSYQTGPAFSIFAPAARTEVGRGGVYRTAQGRSPPAAFQSMDTNSAVPWGYKTKSKPLRQIRMQSMPPLRYPLLVVQNLEPKAGLLSAA